MYAVKGSSLDLSCRLSDPLAEVTLWHGASKTVPNGKKITQEGQIFTVHNLQESDAGMTNLYKCRARNPKNGATEDFPIGCIARLFSHGE